MTQESAICFVFEKGEEGGEARISEFGFYRQPLSIKQKEDRFLPNAPSQLQGLGSIFSC